MNCPANESPNEMRARRMYARVLSSWAMDLMSLRRAGLDRPVPRWGTGAAVSPPARAIPGTRAGPWHSAAEAEELRWRPGRLAA